MPYLWRKGTDMPMTNIKQAREALEEIQSEAITPHDIGRKIAPHLKVIQATLKKLEAFDATGLADAIYDLKHSIAPRDCDTAICVQDGHGRTILEAATTLNSIVEELRGME